MKRLSLALMAITLVGCSSADDDYETMYQSVDPAEWPDVLASVNGDSITKEVIEPDYIAFTEAYEEAADETVMVQENILQQLLTSEIDSLLLSQAADEQEIEVSDDEVDEVIAELLEQEGIETDEAYAQAVEASGLTVAEYEAAVKQDLIRFRFVEVEKGTPEVTEEEIEQRYEAQYAEQELADVRDQIEAELVAGQRQVAATELLAELMAEAEIEIFIERN